MGYNFIAMINDVSRILHDECLLNPNQPVIVGVSGGPDSLCTLDLLIKNEFAPVVAHFNHRLRPEADQDVEVIRALADQLGLPFVIDQADVKEIATDERKSIEEAARDSRYQFLFRSAEKFNAQAVAVGHTADDQVETVLMHLLRGAGSSGLRGMEFRSLPNAWSKVTPLVRPLLSTWRDQVEAYCQARDLTPLVDSTNQDVTYFRNRLRHELIPDLESYNPSIKEVIWRMAEVMRADLQLVQGAVEAAWQDCLLSDGVDYVELDRGRSSRQPLSIQRNLIRRAIASLRPGLRDISFQAVEIGRKYLHFSLPPAEVDLIAGLKLVSEADSLWVAEWDANLPLGDWPQIEQGETSLQVPGNMRLAGDWQLTADEVLVKDLDLQQVRLNEDPFQAWMDADQLNSPLLVRSRRAGDRFQPFGMAGHSVKVADFMINEKLPQRARENWPLVCDGEQIIWVPGLRSAHRVRLISRTGQAIHLRVHRD